MISSTSSSVPGTWPLGTARPARGLLAAFPASAADPIQMARDGIVRVSRRGGEALTGGLTIAIDEVNAKGGVRRKVESARRDDEANPARVIAARELVQREKAGRRHRRTRHARRAGDRAFRKRAEGALHRSVGGAQGSRSTGRRTTTCSASRPETTSSTRRS